MIIVYFASASFNILAILEYGKRFPLVFCLRLRDSLVAPHDHLVVLVLYILVVLVDSTGSCWFLWCGKRFNIVFHLALQLLLPIAPLPCVLISQCPIGGNSAEIWFVFYYFRWWSSCGVLCGFFWVSLWK